MDSVSGFDISSDPLLSAVFVSALATLAVSGILVVCVLVLRWKTRLAEAFTARVDARWRPRFAAVIIGDAVPAERPGAGELHDVLSLWNQNAAAVKGPARERLAEYGRRCGFGEQAAALLARRSVHHRLLGLASLEHLADRTQFAVALPLATDPSPAVSLAAARAALRMDPVGALAALLPQMLEREDWPVTHLADALREGWQPAIGDRIARAFAEVPESHLRRLLSIARVVPAERIAPQVRAVLEGSRDPECLCAALRLVADPRDAPRVRSLLRHPAWAVRLAAVKALARIAFEDDVPRFIAALSDPEWWVRQRAADALVKLPFLDRAQLERLREVVSDRYAKDALARALAEGGMR